MNEPIINGIDVSECKLYDYGICYSEMAEDLNCEKNPDCYFKQLKRLQEENEELKKYQYTQEYLQSEIEKRQKALEEIQKMFSEPCIEGENCFTCNAKCSNKDVLNITVEALNDRD